MTDIEVTLWTIALLLGWGFMVYWLCVRKYDDNKCQWRSAKAEASGICHRVGHWHLPRLIMGDEFKSTMNEPISHSSELCQTDHCALPGQNVPQGPFNSTLPSYYKIINCLRLVYKSYIQLMWQFQNLGKIPFRLTGCSIVYRYKSLILPLLVSWVAPHRLRWCTIRRVTSPSLRSKVHL